MKIKLAILASRFPYPLDQGDRLRLFHQIRYLSEKFEISLICTTHERVSDYAISVLKEYCNQVFIIKLGLAGSIMSGINFFLKGKPLQLSMFYSEGARRRVDHILSELNAEIVYCHLFRMAEYCKDLSIPKVIDIMDAFSASMQRRSGISRFPLNLIYKLESSRIKTYEEKILESFEIATIISDQDKSILPEKYHDKLFIVPNGVDSIYFSNDTDVKEERVYDLVFVGNMGYLPNIEAAEYLVNTLMPALNNTISGRTLTLHIAGSRPSGRVKILSSPTVTVSGWMDDIRKAYRSGKIFCAPIFSGTGQQNKIFEAMAMELPCITTNTVNNAIQAKEGEEILLAHDVETFVNQMNLLLNDNKLRENLSKNGRKFVVQNYSWNQLTFILESILLKIHQKNKLNK